MACRRARRRERGEEGPARRRARRRHPGLPQICRAQIARSRLKSAPDKKGDFYVALIERPGRATAGGRGRRSCRRSCAVSPGRNPCAGAAGASLGTAAAFDPLHLRRQGGAVRDRRHRQRQGDARPSLHGAEALCCEELRRLCGEAAQGLRHPRSTRARGSSWRARRSSPPSKSSMLVEDVALLAENAGLTEWPVVLMGSFDESFLEVPGEVLATSMKAHQKCFSLKRGEQSRQPLHHDRQSRSRGSAARPSSPAMSG